MYIFGTTPYQPVPCLWADCIKLGLIFSPHTYKVSEIKSETHPCEISNVQGNPFACVGIYYIGGSTLPPIWATWRRQCVQVVAVFWCITIIGWWGYYIIIQVDLLMNRVIRFLLNIITTVQLKQVISHVKFNFCLAFQSFSNIIRFFLRNSTLWIDIQMSVLIFLS